MDLAQPQLVSQRKRVLIVDDDDAIRAMLAKVVERIGVEVDTARDGVEAIELLEADGYSAVLLDLMMPRVDGYGVLSHMMENDPEALSCTIIASAVPQQEVLRRFNVPVYRIHPKPFELSRLLADIRGCVGAPEQTISES